MCVTLAYAAPANDLSAVSKRREDLVHVRPLLAGQRAAAAAAAERARAGPGGLSHDARIASHPICVRARCSKAMAADARAAGGYFHG